MTTALVRTDVTFGGLFVGGASPAEVAAHLDALDEPTRLRQVRAFPRARIMALFDWAERALDLDGLCPADGQPHLVSGRNSTPMFPYFTKRMLRRPGEAEGVGHNLQMWSWISGPGYFVARDSAEHGGAIFDYYRLPTWAPEGWPKIKPNTGLIAGPSFGHMIDLNRRVSRDVIVGRALKMGKVLAHYVVTRVSRSPQGG